MPGSGSESTARTGRLRLASRRAKLPEIEDFPDPPLPANAILIIRRTRIPMCQQLFRSGCHPTHENDRRCLLCPWPTPHGRRWRTVKAIRRTLRLSTLGSSHESDRPLRSLEGWQDRSHRQPVPPGVPRPQALWSPPHWQSDRRERRLRCPLEGQRCRRRSIFAHHTIAQLANRRNIKPRHSGWLGQTG